MESCLMIDLQYNLDKLNEKINNALIKAGRKNEPIRLVAVTKTVSVDLINTSIDFGIKDIGENKVQEIQNKYENVKKPVKWHMIGHLQTNKVKAVISKVDLIHSVDSIRLMEEINGQAAQLGKIMEILIQVNISGEVSKFGINKYDIWEFFERIGQLHNVHIAGLMTIAPFAPEQSRLVFAQLYKLFVDIKSKNYDNVTMEYLSMGMTNDFEAAILEGANVLRIGAGIFGARQYL